jgi:hypothetical protein
MARYDHTLAASHQNLLLLLLLLLLLMLLLLPHMAAAADYSAATAAKATQPSSGGLVHSTAGAVAAAIAERWMDLLLLLRRLLDLGHLAHHLLELRRALRLLLRQLRDPVLEFSRIICRHYYIWFGIVRSDNTTWETRVQINRSLSVSCHY